MEQILASGKTDIKLIKELIAKSLEMFHISMFKIILFGSRARKDFTENSDWDFLIVINNAINRNEKKAISHQIRKDLAEYHIACDVIIRTSEEVTQLNRRVVSTTKTAIKEGIQI